MSTQASSSFEMLHESVQRWIWRQGWTTLRDIQENSIPVVLRRDCDVIISASTAGGKTEAAFLPILSNVISEGGVGYDVLYVSPLKALINDQTRRLQDMTADIGIDVTPWHGDINASRKAKSLADPSGILIITPESLESFLINRNSSIKRAFSQLKYVVIDELHAFIGNERGKQLQSLLSRIEFMIGNKVPRIAMSATFSNYDKVKRFLRQDETFPCEIPNQGKSSHDTMILVKEYIPQNDKDIEQEIATELFHKLRGSNNLAFTNSRSDAERYAVMLGDMCEKRSVPNEFRVHHGSLSKAEREQVELELQKGATPITALCTSTLELGVDIGKVKSIAQIGVANMVSGLRQRLGRSGRRNEPSVLRILSVEHAENGGILYDLRANLVQNCAVIELLRRAEYEEPVIHKTHFSTLIQQILSLIASHSGFYPKEGWDMLCNRGAFRNITPQIFLDILKCLGAKGIISQLNTGQIIVGKEGERLLRKLDFYTAFVTPIDYDVINNSDAKRIGVVQSIPKVKSLMILAGKRWIVEKVDEKSKSIYVTRISSGGAISFSSEVAEIDEIITREMKKIYLSDEVYPYLDHSSESHLELAKAREFFSTSKLDENAYVGNTLFTWAGAKVNRTIALMCKLRLDKRLDYTHLYIGGISPANIAHILSQPKPTGEELAALEARPAKEKQKYDEYLSDSLIDIEYANTYLDVDRAWEELKLHSSASGYEEVQAVKSSENNGNTKTEKYDFRHIKDISNVIKYETLSDPLQKVFHRYIENGNLGCSITTGATPPGAPDYAMPVNFLLRKGDKTLAILLISTSKTKRYSVLETEALCRENGIGVCKFYFECDNEEEYVVERIKNLLV